MKNLTEQESNRLKELIDSFENHIRNHGDPWFVRYRFSNSKRLILELYKKKGQDVVEVIVKHLKSNPPGQEMELDKSWACVLREVSKVLKDHGPFPHPPVTDFRLWLEWAESIVLK